MHVLTLHLDNYFHALVCKLAACLLIRAGTFGDHNKLGTFKICNACLIAMGVCGYNEEKANPRDSKCNVD